MAGERNSCGAATAERANAAARHCCAGTPDWDIRHACILSPNPKWLRSEVYEGDGESEGDRWEMVGAGGGEGDTTRLFNIFRLFRLSLFVYNQQINMKSKKIEKSEKSEQF